MIEDFTPASTTLSSGVVIKQHLLERNRQHPAQVSFEEVSYTGSITSSFITGGDGGVFSSLPYSVVQSWTETIPTLIGDFQLTRNDKREFFDAYSKLNPGGHLIINVPAFNFLYSKFDKDFGHFKR